MPLAVMGEGLGLRPSPIFTHPLVVATTLPRLDPAKFGMADYDLYGGKVDFSIAQAHGLKRPIIRVGQGYYGIDPQFVASAAGSKGLFSSRDFYWMLDNKQSANGQGHTCTTALLNDGKLDTASILWADFELAPVNASFLYGFLTTVHNDIPNLRLGIYTGLSYWATYGSTDVSWAQYPLWLAWPISPYQEPPALKPWPYYTYHQWTFNGDGVYYGQQSAGLDLDYENPRLVSGNAVIVVRPKATHQLDLTPSSTDVLPLKTPVQQAAEYGWEAAMNGGAGFAYTDATHARVKGISKSRCVEYSNDQSFGYYIADDCTWIPFARRMIDQGVINPNLDTVELASWSMLGFDSESIYEIVTKGREGTYGMTQMQAAQFALAMGITELYLEDSGHSSGIEENGQLLYSEYGEAIPQCIGLKPKGVTSVSTRVTVKPSNIANLKDMATGALLHTAQPGEYVYGDKSLAGTDVIGFSHYYTSLGVLKELPVTSTKGGKVSLGNNVDVVDGVTEPPINPNPTPTPTVVSVVVDITTTVTYSDGTTAKFTKTGVSLDPA